MKKNIIIISTLLMILSGCSAKVGSQTVLPNVPEKNSSTGPFNVDFNNSTTTYQHSFKVPINQSEGKVEYFVKTNDSADIELVSSTLNVTGCSASQVILQMFWLPDSQKTEGYYLSVGEIFKTRAGIQGTFMYVIRGLSGCTAVELLTSLHRKPKPTLPQRTCNESHESSCKVEVYCTEDFPGKKYLEIEVWNESWGRTLRKFSLHDDGTRSLTTMDTVLLSTVGPHLSLIANNGMSSLDFDATTGLGKYSQKAAGQTFPTDVICQSYL